MQYFRQPASLCNIIYSAFVTNIAKKRATNLAANLGVVNMYLKLFFERNISFRVGSHYWISAAWQNIDWIFVRRFLYVCTTSSFSKNSSFNSWRTLSQGGVRVLVKNVSISRSHPSIITCQVCDSATATGAQMQDAGSAIFQERSQIHLDINNCLK